MSCSNVLAKSLCISSHLNLSFAGPQQICPDLILEDALRVSFHFNPRVILASTVFVYKYSARLEGVDRTFLPATPHRPHMCIQDATQGATAMPKTWQAF